MEAEANALYLAYFGETELVANILTIKQKWGKNFDSKVALVPCF